MTDIETAWHVRETDFRLAMISTNLLLQLADRREEDAQQIFIDQCGRGVQLAEWFGAEPGWPKDPLWTV